MIHLASDTFIVFQVFNIHESSSKYLPVLVGGRAAIRSESDIAGLARRRKNGVFLSVLGSDDMQLLDNVSGEVTPQPQRKRSRSVDAMMLAPSLCVNDSEYRRKPPLTSDALLDRNVSRSQSDTEENGPDQVFEALALPEAPVFTFTSPYSPLTADDDEVHVTVPFLPQRQPSVTNSHCDDISQGSKGFASDPDNQYTCKSLGDIEPGRIHSVVNGTSLAVSNSHYTTLAVTTQYCYCYYLLLNVYV